MLAPGTWQHQNPAGYIQWFISPFSDDSWDCIHTFVEWVVNRLRRKLIKAGHADPQRFRRLCRKKEPGQEKVKPADFHFHLFELQALQQTTPHFLQWWRRFTNVNWTWKVNFMRKKTKNMTNLFAVHACACLAVRHPHSCVLVHSLLPRLA